MLSFSLARQRGMWSSLETQSAEIAREFLSGENIIVPHLNGVEDNEKPAFFYWIVAIISLLFGKVTELSSRLPSLISILCVILFFLILERKTKIRYMAIFASAIYITSPKIFWMSQVARMDMVFSMLCFGAVSCFFLYSDEEKGKKKNLYHTLFFIFSALAVLCKGPAGIVLPSLPVFFFYVLNKKFKDMGKFIFSYNLLVFFAVALPWYILVIIKTEGRFFTKFLLSDNIGRFIGPLKTSISHEFSKRQPLWFYIPHFLGGFFPWSIFFLFFVSKFFKDKGKGENFDTIFLGFFSLTFIFFSLAGIKRSDYLLPLYPACSIFIARYMATHCSWKSFRIIWTPVSLFLVFFVFFLLILSVQSIDLKNIFFNRFFPSSDLQKAEWILSYLHQVFPITFTLFILILGFFIFGYIRKNLFMSLSTLLATSAAILLYIGLLIIPFHDQNRDIRLFCTRTKDLVQDNELWFYGFWNDEFVFYMDRFIDPRTPDKGMGKDEFLWIMKQKDRKVSFLIRKKDFLELKKENVDIPYVFKENVPGLYPDYLISNVRMVE